MKNIKWDWNPKISIGPITFGDLANPAIEKYNLTRTPEYDAPEQETYQFIDKTTIGVEDKIITSISCKQNFFYEDTNLIGASINKIRDLLGIENRIDEDFEEEYCLEFDDYNLIAWINKETDRISAISCFSESET
jgi:hypothetical protein